MGDFAVDYESVMSKLRAEAESLSVGLSSPPSPPRLFAEDGQACTKRKPRSEINMNRESKIRNNKQMDELDNAALVLQLKSELSDKGVEMVELQGKMIELRALCDRFKTKLHQNEKLNDKSSKKASRDKKDLQTKISQQENMIKKLQHELTNFKRKQDEEGKLVHSTISKCENQTKKAQNDLTSTKQALLASQKREEAEKVNYEKLVSAVKRKTLEDEEKFRRKIVEIEAAHELERKKYKEIVADLNKQSVEDMKSLHYENKQLKEKYELLQQENNTNKNLVSNMHNLEGIVSVVQAEAKEAQMLKKECNNLREQLASTRIKLEKEQVIINDQKKLLKEEMNKYNALYVEKTENETNMKKILQLVQDKEQSTSSENRTLTREMQKKEEKLQKYVGQLEQAMKGTQQELVELRTSSFAELNRLRSALERETDAHDKTKNSFNELSKTAERSRDDFIKTQTRLREQIQDLTKEVEKRTEDTDRLIKVDQTRSITLKRAQDEMMRFQEEKIQVQSILRTVHDERKRHKEHIEHKDILLNEEKRKVSDLGQELTNALNEIEIMMNKFSDKRNEFDIELKQSKEQQRKLYQLLIHEKEKTAKMATSAQGLSKEQEFHITNLSGQLNLALAEKKNVYENNNEVSTRLQEKDNEMNEMKRILSEHIDNQKHLMTRVQDMAAEWKLKAEEKDILCEELKRELSEARLEITPSFINDISQLDETTCQKKLADFMHMHQMSIKTISQLRAQINTITKQPSELKQNLRELKVLLSKKEVEISTLTLALQQQNLMNLGKTPSSSSSSTNNNINDIQEMYEKKKFENELLYEQIATLRKSLALYQQKGSSSSSTTSYNEEEINKLKKMVEELMRAIGQKDTELKKAYREIVELNETTGEQDKLYQEQSKIHLQLVKKLNAQVLYINELQDKCGTSSESTSQASSFIQENKDDRDIMWQRMTKDYSKKYMKLAMQIHQQINYILTLFESIGGKSGDKFIKIRDELKKAQNLNPDDILTIAVEALQIIVTEGTDSYASCVNEQCNIQ